jgi:hypothetical protein
MLDAQQLKGLLAGHVVLRVVVEYWTPPRTYRTGKFSNREHELFIQRCEEVVSTVMGRLQYGHSPGDMRKWWALATE